MLQTQSHIIIVRTHAWLPVDWTQIFLHTQYTYVYIYICIHTHMYIFVRLQQDRNSKEARVETKIPQTKNENQPFFTKKK